MSLNFKLPAPHDRFYRTATEDSPMHGIKAGDSYLDPNVEACILWTMSTTVGSLKTEEDAREHYVRARFAYGEEAFPLETALSLVGLTTNVFPRETESKFLVRIGKSRLSDLRWDAKHPRPRTVEPDEDTATTLTETDYAGAEPLQEA